MAQSRPTYRDLGDGDLGVWIAYDLRHHAKALPGARWDKNLKCWRVKRMFAAEVARLVADLGGEQSTELTGPLRGVFRALPQALRRPTHRALAQVWHPDRDGDTSAMQSLNAVWSEVER